MTGKQAPTRLALARASTVLIALSTTGPVLASELPAGFVRLGAIAPHIEQDIRYHGNHNFVGRPVAGYEAPDCILTEQAASALIAVEKDLNDEGLGLKVYDCYRPAEAVADFVDWATDLGSLDMQSEFYPRVDKNTLFDLGYIAERSGHSRGSTVDLAIRRLDQPASGQWEPGDALVDCVAPESTRYADGTIDFGTGFDCFDDKAHHGAEGIEPEASENRAQLAAVMAKHGFNPYQQEWWHYTLVDEPFPETYFNFPVTAAE